LKNKRVVIFDLFGTLLKEKGNDFYNGLNWLREEILVDCTPETVRSSAEKFRRTYMLDRTATYKEASHFSQLEFFKSKIGFRKKMPLSDIEWGFFNAIRNNEPLAGVFELLQWLKGQDYLLFVMSNTMFSALTVKKHLDELGLAKYFNGVYTSGDCGNRKPGKRFFSSVFHEIKKQTDIKKRDVIFIGNSLEKDMLGARAFGYTPVWLSSEDRGFGEYVADCVRVSDFFECRKYFESNYICIANVSKRYSVADGIGNRIVVFLQGCHRCCMGCHNQSTWDFANGKVYGIKELVIQILSHMSSYSRNITISGGEPLEQLEPLEALLKALRLANINVCLYTGYEFNEVPDKIKDKIDYLKTGVYVDELKTFEKSFLGSTNQKFWEKGTSGEWTQKI
jgi:FMN phosphatase YigB (HAD superfamily)